MDLALIPNKQFHPAIAVFHHPDVNPLSENDHKLFLRKTSKILFKDKIKTVRLHIRSKFIQFLKEQRQFDEHGASERNRLFHFNAVFAHSNERHLSCPSIRLSVCFFPSHEETI